MKVLAIASWLQGRVAWHMNLAEENQLTAVKNHIDFLFSFYSIQASRLVVRVTHSQGLPSSENPFSHTQEYAKPIQYQSVHDPVTPESLYKCMWLWGTSRYKRGGL